MVKSMGCACCAVAVMCANGVSGMDDGSVETRFDNPLNKFVFSDFSDALYYRPDMETLVWRAWFASVAPFVSDFLSEQSTYNLDVSYSAVYYVSRYRFDHFVKYCDLDSSDQLARSNILLFLSLFPTIIGRLQPNHSKELVDDFNFFLSKCSQCRASIVSKEDELLFSRVAEVIEPYMNN
jgi:hypothetical protein